jgi:hypothetical protein
METVQEAEDSWSYGTDIFKLNALFRNPALPGVQGIQRVNVAAFGRDNNSVTKPYNTLSKDIPGRSRPVIVNITSSDQDEGSF